MGTKSGFSFRDVKENAKRLVAFHKAQKNYNKMKQQEAEKKGVILPELLAIDIKKALRSMQRKIDSYFGNTSKYKLHQGKQECARRLRPGSAANYASKVMA